MLCGIAALFSLDDADELSPAAREACHRDQVWAERDHLAAALNADRRAAFERLKELLRLAPCDTKPRKLAPTARKLRMVEVFGQPRPPFHIYRSVQR